jgi:hypothetical protein
MATALRASRRYVAGISAGSLAHFGELQTLKRVSAIGPDPIHSLATFASLCVRLVVGAMRAESSSSSSRKLPRQSRYVLRRCRSRQGT